VRTVLVAIVIGAACALFNVRLSIVDGESMAPSIRAGDSVVTIGPPTDQLTIGSILLVRDGERRLLHRLRAMSGEQLWMQGDASLSGDSRPVQRSDVLGQLALVIPTSHLFRAIRTAASFTASLPVSVSLKSSGGVVAEQGARSISGAASTTAVGRPAARSRAKPGPLSTASVAPGRAAATDTAIKAAGGSCEVRPCDLNDHAAVQALVDGVAETHGRLDILVNNAGITRDTLLLRMTDEQWDEVIHVNLRSIFVSCRAAIRPMMRGKFGRIVNIGSVSGVSGTRCRVWMMVASSVCVVVVTWATRATNRRIETALVVSSAPWSITFSTSSGPSTLAVSWMPPVPQP
jgi:3-oxoacyl-[acyl-carrier protein] reductase